MKRRWREGLGAKAGWEREGERERAGGGPGAWAAQRSAERALGFGVWGKAGSTWGSGPRGDGEGGKGLGRFSLMG